jgi:flagellar biosynthesis GTPase FlhF
VQKAAVEVYELIANRYQQCSPNERGHYPIGSLGVELGIWQGQFVNQTLPWLRWWDSAGQLLLSGDERAEQEKQRADEEMLRAEQEKQRAEQEKQRAEQERQRAEQEKQRADEEMLRAEQEKQRREQLESFLRSQGFDPNHLPGG